MTGQPSITLEQPARRVAVWPLAILIAAILLLSFAIQWPTARVADWVQFAFYDPGTMFKADRLMAKGYLPTIDFGYTHGLIPLLLARLGIAVMGPVPPTFFVLTLLAEMVMAWALARLFVTLRLRWPAKVLFFAAIPMAILPAYLTLTHPLEAMLILLALADQAAGKRSRALALLTACLFVKPSMAYVYGFVLLVILIFRHYPRWRDVLYNMIPAAGTFIVIFVALAAWVGAAPVIRTLIPVTGAKTYALAGFGFFAPQGRAFWLGDDPGFYLVTPAGIFLFTAILCALAAIAVAIQGFARRHPTSAQALPPPHREILLTIGILHTTFIFIFYGWTGSWTYYAYLPVLALVIVINLVPRRTLQWIAVTPLIAWLGLSYSPLIGAVALDWKFKQVAADHLRAYPMQLDEWHRMLDAARSRSATATRHPPRTLVMTIGWIRNLPPNTALPDAWFPEPGIPTASEIARVKKQAAAADCIILWQQYGTLDLWNSSDFADVRRHFAPVIAGTWLTLLRRIPQSTTASVPATPTATQP